MLYSQFARYYAENADKAPVAIRRAIAQEAVKRATPVAHRSAPLDFRDLFDRMEAAISPR